MPRPPIDFQDKLQRILQHTESLPQEAKSPRPHYVRSVTDLWNLRSYFERKVGEGDHYPSVLKDHVAALDRMLIANLVEAFERFLKETAAICVNHLAECVLDDRFDKLGQIKGSSLAVYFGEESLGKALCESGTWLDCDQVNSRFRGLLSDPFDQSGGKFWIFPIKGKQPESEQFRYSVMNLLWQLRHTMVHNLGQITHSDGVKFRLMARQQVATPRLLVPGHDDVRYVKRFLDETVEGINRRVGERLAELLSAFHADYPELFDAQQTANELAAEFGIVLSVDGVSGVLSPENA